MKLARGSYKYLGSLLGGGVAKGPRGVRRKEIFGRSSSKNGVGAMAKRAGRGTFLEKNFQRQAPKAFGWEGA